MIGRRCVALLRLGFVLCLTGSLDAAPSPDATTARLSSLLANVTNATAHRYRATDDHGRTLDCLKIVELAPGDYLGVYHTLHEREFQLHLGRSTNLLHWSHRAVLDQRASQGALWHGPRGDFLLAYEVNVPKAVLIRLRHYADLDALLHARFDREIDLPRTLAPTAEGTPSFERVELNGDLATSRIDLRIHYYREMKVDRAARGTLLGFTNWTARTEPSIDEALEVHGVRGNIGDRDHVEFGGRKYLVQEGQLARNDWTAWRVFLLDDAGAQAWPIPVQTHAGSRSFANPAVTRLRNAAGKWCYAVTLFLPSQGNARSEAGTLIYVVPADG